MEEIVLIKYFKGKDEASVRNQVWDWLQEQGFERESQMIHAQSHQIGDEFHLILTYEDSEVSY